MIDKRFGFVNLKQIRKAAGKTQQQTADDLDVPIDTYRGWEQLRHYPSPDMAIAIADYFDTQVDNLLGRTPLPPNAIPAGAGSTATAPLYGRIAAGEALEMIEDYESVQLPNFVRERYPNGFFLEVTGDSMDLVISDGAYAYIDPDATYRDGDVVAVNINGYDATLKRYSKSASGVTLLPSSTNPEHEPQPIKSEKARILGKMVWMMTPIDFRF